MTVSDNQSIDILKSIKNDLLTAYLMCSTENKVTCSNVKKSYDRLEMLLTLIDTNE